MNYYIVDSVKGGCGKSTIALWKAVCLKHEDPHNRKVCYVDLDILGTSMEKFIGCRKSLNVKYLNDLFKGERNAVKKKKVTTPLCFKVSVAGSKKIVTFFNDTNKMKISAIFCSPEQEDKNLFRPNYLTGGQCIDYTFFAIRMKELFEELEDGGFTDVVIDMPPNSDPYTDSMFDLLLHNTNFSSPPKNWKVTLLLISSFDRANMEANINWYHELYTKDHNWHPFDKIEHYFNDVRGCFSKPSITLDTIIKNSKKEFEANCATILAGYIKELKCNNMNTNQEISFFTVGYNEMLSLKAILLYDGFSLGLDVNPIKINEIIN